MESALTKTINAYAYAAQEYTAFHKTFPDAKGYDAERKAQLYTKMQDLEKRVWTWAEGHIIMIQGFYKVKGKFTARTLSKPFKYYINASEDDARDFFEKIVKLKYTIDETKAIIYHKIPTGVMLTK